MRSTLLTAALWSMLDCSQPPPKRLAENAEVLGAARAGSPELAADALQIVLHERKGRDNAHVIAVQQRTLTRDQLRWWLQRQLGSAKHATAEIYAGQEAYAACVRNRFRVLRGPTDRDDERKCTSGTVIWMDPSEPRVLYWGSAAPAAGRKAPTAEQSGLDALDAASDDALGADDPDALRPLSPGADFCMEMYSACSGTPPVCTSAPLRLSCGESGSIPGTRRRVTCVCP